MLVPVPDTVGDFTRFYMIKFQYLVKRVFCDLPLIVQRGRNAAAHDRSRNIDKGVRKNIVVVTLALFYLFVKPTHYYVFASCSDQYIQGNSREAMFFTL